MNKPNRPILAMPTALKPQELVTPNTSLNPKSETQTSVFTQKGNLTPDQVNEPTNNVTSNCEINSLNALDAEDKAPVKNLVRFSLEDLRADDSLNGFSTVKSKGITACKNPTPALFFQVHPEYKVIMHTIYTADNSLYILPGNMTSELKGSKKQVFFLCISEHDHMFFLYAPPRSTNSWTSSKYRIIEAGKKSWIKYCSDMEQSRYVSTEIKPSSSTKHPEWPEEIDMEELINQAFYGHIISSLDHPAAQELLGRHL